MITYPEPLKQGDFIGITAPSSGVTGILEKKLDNAIKQFEELGYRCIESSSVRSQYKLASASPKQRADEFLELYHNKQVKAIIPPWGGEFLMEILPFINFSELTKPKWILGFSDISTLLFSVTLKTNIATAHGPNFLDFGNTPIDNSVLNVLEILRKSKGEEFEQVNLAYYQKEWLNLTETSFPPYNLTEKVEWKLLFQEVECHFKGRLIGGCLDTICKLIGTSYAPVPDFIDQYKEEGIIWYLESCDMKSNDIYRTLWQMKMNGWFKNCKGLLYGRAEGYSDVRDFTIIDALNNTLSDINIPTIYNVDLGHLPPQLTLINGAYGEISYINGKGKIKQTLK